jgi:competence protein ComEC
MALGIISAHVTAHPSFLFVFLLATFLLLLLLSWVISRGQIFPNIRFGIITFCCFFLIGYCNYQLRAPAHQKDHYSRFSSESDPDLIQLKIKEVLKPDLFSEKYIAEVQYINKTPAQGRILLSIQKDSLSESFTIDDQLLIRAPINPIGAPLNPYQFDYKAYMRSMGVLYQLQTDQIAILSHKTGTRSVKGMASDLRNFFLKKLKKSTISSEERSIIQALILGQKKDIDPELYTSYTRAGAVHILAVSGLHVGILYLILSGLFRPLIFLPKGRLIRSAVMVLLLFGFALIAGWSPSVVRAATMFSLFAIAGMLRRPTNSINTLFLSFLILLIANPSWLFQVGFQLSYLAVFFILWIQPRLYKLYAPNNYILRKAWAITTVSISAQLGVLPLSLYYFHQFPGLFLLTNLVILPFLAFLLGFGLLVLLLLSINSLPNELANSYNFMIRLMNSFIEWVAEQEDFIISEIHFTGWNVLACYLVIIFSVLLLKHFSYRRCIWLLGSIILLVTVFIHHRISADSQLILFHKSRNTIMGIQQKEKLVVYSEINLGDLKNTTLIKNFRVGAGINEYSEAPLPYILQYKSNLILVVDSLGVYPSERTIDIVILRNSPKINLNRLIDGLEPKQIIADGSNYISYVKRWETTCKKRKLLFHHTGKKGAFILE